MMSYLHSTLSSLLSVNMTNLSSDNSTLDEGILYQILYKYRDYGYGTYEACEELRIATGLQRWNVALMGKIVILCLSVVHLLKELFQVTQVSLWSTFQVSVAFCVVIMFVEN